MECCVRGWSERTVPKTSTFSPVITNGIGVRYWGPALKRTWAAAASGRTVRRKSSSLTSNPIIVNRGLQRIILKWTATLSPGRERLLTDTVQTTDINGVIERTGRNFQFFQKKEKNFQLWFHMGPFEILNR